MASNEKELNIEVLRVLESNNWDHQASFKALQPYYKNNEIFSAIRLCASSRAQTIAHAEKKKLLISNENSTSDKQEDESMLSFKKTFSTSESLDGVLIRGLNPLIFASSTFDEQLAIDILNHPGFNRDWLTANVDYGYTPLHFAAEIGAERLTLALCQSIRSIPLNSQIGKILPYESLKQEKELKLEYCLDDALKATTSDMHLQKAIVQTGGKTPLHLAAMKGHVGCVRIILSQAIQPRDLVSVPDLDGNTPFVLACIEWASSSNCAQAESQNISLPYPADVGSSPIAVPPYSNHSSLNHLAIIQSLFPHHNPTSFENIPETVITFSFQTGCSLRDDGSGGGENVKKLRIEKALKLPLRSWLMEKKVQDIVIAKERVTSVWEILPHLQPVLPFLSILSSQECDWLISEAEIAATRRGGWLGDRHRGYATTDLRVKNVSKEVDDWVQETIRSRLFPLIQQHFKPPYEASYLFRDLFFVKYECLEEGSQRSVGLHRDGSSLSFNFLLNESSDFEGGGTYFDVPLDITMHNQKGGVVVHSGRRRHAGVEILSGKRMLLVGFIDEHPIEEGGLNLMVQRPIELHFQDHSG